MNFHNNTLPYYCGIDLHARLLYVCILDDKGKTCLHKEISASPFFQNAIITEKPLADLMSALMTRLVSG